MTTAAERAVDLLGPLAVEPATALIQAMLAATEVPWAIGEDPGLSEWLQPDVAPADWFQWLTRLCGARYSAAYTDAQQRAELANPSGWRRGTRQAMIDAIAQTLTGTQYVFVGERSGGDAYTLIVATLTDETPDAAVTEAAAISQKPAGLILTYETIDEQLWSQVADAYATWADVADAYDTWADVQTDTTSS